MTQQLNKGLFEKSQKEFREQTNTATKTLRDFNQNLNGIVRRIYENSLGSKTLIKNISDEAEIFKTIMLEFIRAIQASEIEKKITQRINLAEENILHNTADIVLLNEQADKYINARLDKSISKLKNYESSFTDALQKKTRGAVPKPPSDALSFNIKPQLQDLPHFPGEHAIAQAGSAAVLASMEETTRKITAPVSPGNTQDIQTWSEGVQTAYADISKSANDWGAISQDLTHKVFNGMTDAVVDFATTGKANFSEFARSLVADLLRISTQQLLVNSLSGFSFFSTPNVKAAMGAVIDNGRVQAFARGGVVSQPAYFGLRNGGLGLMAEAGPEAIMPLRRGRNGKLGVASEAPPPTPVNVRVVNVTDPHEITTAMNTGAGERVILNTIVNNHDTIRKLLRVG